MKKPKATDEPPAEPAEQKPKGRLRKRIEELEGEIRDLKTRIETRKEESGSGFSILPGD